MIVYHGTTERHLPAILKNGLQPRGSKSSLWKGAPSRKDCVYVTNAYAVHFAGHAAKGEQRLLVVETDVSPLFLLPDEDFLEQATRKQSGLGLAPTDKPMHYRTSWYRRRLEQFQLHSLMSLELLGTAAHLGEIGRTQIKRYALIDTQTYTDMMWAGHDPTITLMNFAIVGDRYKGWLKWVFGDGELPVKVPVMSDLSRDRIEVVTL